jgi:hypothetical protein
LEQLETKAAASAVPAETHYRIALCYHALGQAPDKARQHYQKASSGCADGYVPEFHLARLERGLPLLSSTQAGLVAEAQDSQELSPDTEQLTTGVAVISTTPAAAVTCGKEVEACIAVISREAEVVLQKGDTELSQDLRIVARYLQDVASEKKPAIPEAPSAGSITCRILGETQPAALFGNAGLFSHKMGAFFAKLTELTAPVCEELSDGFHALASNAAYFRAMELAARLMTYKNPGEAIKQHRADLSPRVLEAIERAVELAKASGNQTLADRLSALIMPIKTELQVGLIIR